MGQHAVAESRQFCLCFPIVTPFSEEERHIRRIKQMEEDTDIVDVNPEV